jgi:hypothetical protein
MDREAILRPASTPLKLAARLIHVHASVHSKGSVYVVIIDVPQGGVYIDK